MLNFKTVVSTSQKLVVNTMYLSSRNLIAGSRNALFMMDPVVKPWDNGTKAPNLPLLFEKLFKSLILFFFASLIVACSNVQNNTKNNLAAESNVKLGLMYLKVGESDLAKRKLLLAIEEDPQSSLAHDAMGYFLESVGDKKAAESYYQRAIALAKPNEKGASFNNYGTYLFRLGKAKESLKYFRLAISDPKYLQVAAAYENAGFAALAFPDKKLARSYFNKSLQYDPKRTKAKQALRKLS